LYIALCRCDLQSLKLNNPKFNKIAEINRKNAA